MMKAYSMEFLSRINAGNFLQGENEGMNYDNTSNRVLR